MITTKSLVLFVLVSLAILCACQGSSRPSSSASLTKIHEQWMAQHGRVYKNETEKAIRFNIFVENFNRITSFNKAGNRSYELGINKFADLNKEELSSLTRGFKKPFSSLATEQTTFRYNKARKLPSYVDWREKGAVTPIKDQGSSCGSCWAFTAAAVVESMNQIFRGQLISLSEQELLDCDSNDDGCDGGFLDTALTYVEENGLASEAYYSYTEQKGYCRNQYIPVAVEIGGFEHVPRLREVALKRAVAHQPVGVSLKASQHDFIFYKGGIFDGYCASEEADHTVAVVGYDTSDDGIPYWIIKNSWGEGWGEAGYMRMKRNVRQKGGLCGITLEGGYYPVPTDY